MSKYTGYWVQSITMRFMPRGVKLEIDIASDASVDTSLLTEKIYNLPRRLGDLIEGVAQVLNPKGDQDGTDRPEKTG